MGPAGRYQILGEFLQGQKVPGIGDERIPAVKGKIGGETFYSFATTPSKLLKIAFVNHQALNHPDGRPAYQRMVSSKRIKDIGHFIKAGGFFATNLLINLTEKPRFDPMSDKYNADPNIKFGWITLPPKYRSAWVIDGQHRLFGYSHLDGAFLDHTLFVVAFEKMKTVKEADLFITINHKQKSVPKSLLVSLLADIRMGDSDPKTALTALGSAVVRALYNDKTSPFFRRFIIHGVAPEANQNLTVWGSLFQRETGILD
jgi:DNA sulfur modification protein DndB